MNAVLASRFSERLYRLALGVQPIDAGRQLPPTYPVAVALEWPSFASPLPPALERDLRSIADRGYTLHDVLRRIDRHASCRHALVFEAGIRGEVAIRVFDLATRRPARLAGRRRSEPPVEVSRRFVPRRFRMPVVDVGDPPDLARLDAVPVGQRTRRPVLFPGAAYDIGADVTGLRGRAVYADAAIPADRRRPVRWARVEARRNGVVVGRAHGDDRGEFLLVVPPQNTAELLQPFDVDVTVSGPPGPAAPPHPIIGSVDPLWDLPVEIAAAPGVTPDGVMDGTTMPATHTQRTTRVERLTYGRTVSVATRPFELT